MLLDASTKCLYFGRKFRKRFGVTLGKLTDSTSERMQNSVDLTLQGGSGFPLIEQLTTAMPELRVIVFSGLADSEEVSREAKRRGAAAYVCKGSDIQVLFNALRTPATAS